jgi:hypothetical protein
MNSETFQSNLKSAAYQARTFANQFVSNDLPPQARFIVRCNRPPNEEIELPLQSDEERYPDIDTETHFNPRILASPEAVSAFLYRQGKVPVWININVDHTDADATYFMLRYCPRFSAEENMIRNSEEGAPPFRVLVPALPPPHVK